MRCLMCGKEKGYGSFRDILIGTDPLCTQCRSSWQKNPLHFRMEGVPCETTYIYDEAFSSCLIQYKECNDEALKDVFLYEVKSHLHRKYRGYTIVPMPSSSAKLRERGFSHLNRMYESAGLPILDLLEKGTDETQKGRSMQERMAMKNRILLKKGVPVPKKVLLADDTITTGSTIKGALNALKGKECTIRIYSASANKSWKP